MSRFGLLSCLILFASALSAHPMGNFSINHYSALHVTAEAVEVEYLVDMAEIPTFQECPQAHLSSEQLHAKAVALADGLHLSLSGRHVSINVVREQSAFTPGAGGLPTLKLAFLYRAPLLPGIRAA